MNTKLSKITLKKEDLPLRNSSTQSQARISRELSLNLLLYVVFPTNSRQILMEFFRNAEINHQPVCRNRSEGRGVCTQAINLRLQKGIALLTFPVNDNLHTCSLHRLYIHGFSQILLEACRLRLNINYWLIKNNIRITNLCH